MKILDLITRAAAEAKAAGWEGEEAVESVQQVLEMCDEAALEALGSFHMDHVNRAIEAMVAGVPVPDDSAALLAGVEIQGPSV